MIDTLVPRTLFALSLVVMPAAAAAQSSPSDTDPQQTAEDTPQSDAPAASEESDSSEQSEGDEQTSDPASDSGDTAPDDADSEQEAPSGDRASEDSEGTASEGTESEQAPEESEGADSETSPTQTPSTSPPKVEGMESDSPESNEAGSEIEGAASQSPGEDDEESQEEGKKKSPIADLAEESSGNEEDASDGFEPVGDIDEQSLEQLTPAEVYPYLEWDGAFRVRTDADVNFDLDTDGTSAILPPIENDRPTGAPAKSDADVLWGTDMDLRLEPTIHISEGLRVHIETAIFDNVVFGSLSDRRLTRSGRGLTGSNRALLRPDPTRTVHDSNQIPPREREWFEDSIQINELWGEVDMFLGELRAGRMDNHWGLGMHSNSGDCLDCDYGDHVDRIRFLTKPFGFYTSASIDFPDQGVSSQSAVQIDGQPYDLSQIDDARQYTFSVFKKPRSEKDKKVQQQTLKEDEAPVVNGGARFTLRSQKGVFVPSDNDNPRDGELVYRGLNMYVPDLWAQFLYAPDPGTKIRVALETVGVFGDIDNTSTDQVGTSGGGTGGAVNCFDEGNRNANPEQCTSTGNLDDTTAGITQFGTALESEFYFGGPVRFGLNGGFASGGEAPNWGYESPTGEGLDFYRFDPNYHVDLILFREVIGTVTNAYYFNPYAQARFFESAERRVEVQLDTILSRATNIEGTPAGREGDRWLGLEIDGAARYLKIGQFQAGIEGGILFPFGALNAKLDRARLTQPFSGASERFNSDANASIAWTVQGNFAWKF